MTSHPLFITLNHFIYDIKFTISDIISTISDLTSTVSVSSHPPFWWYHTLCMCHITPTICITSYTLYKASQPHLMTSHQTIYDTTSTVSLSSHPDYQSHNLHCMYDIRATICMTSYELHMTSHPLFMISPHSMTPHPLYLCHHTQ